MDISTWYGLWVPKGTSKDIIARLNASMVQILASPQVKQRFAELGIESSPLVQQSPEALRAYQKEEAERWWPIIKAANIRAEGVLDCPASPGVQVPNTLAAVRGYSRRKREFATDKAADVISLVTAGRSRVLAVKIACTLGNQHRGH